MNASTLVQELWNYCNVLRDDGMSYGDFVEQLTYLLFLEMADERSRPPYNQPSLVPAPYAWPALLARDGDALFDHYRHTLEALGNERGTLGLIFNKAQKSNGRLARLLALLMVLQAGLPPLDFSPLTGVGKRVYIGGIHAAVGRNYAPLTALFLRVIERSRRRAASNAR